MIDLGWRIGVFQGAFLHMKYHGYLTSYLPSTTFSKQPLS
jgi:hypothetical protein